MELLLEGQAAKQARQCIDGCDEPDRLRNRLYPGQKNDDRLEMLRLAHAQPQLMGMSWQHVVLFLARIAALIWKWQAQPKEVLS